MYIVDNVSLICRPHGCQKKALGTVAGDPVNDDF